MPSARRTGKLRDRILLAGWIAYFTLLVSATLAPFVREPATLLSGSGDGIKNHFTFLYALAHGIPGEWTWFRGFNYPFGDHVVMTDGQPLLVWGLRLIASVGGIQPDLATWLSIHDLILFAGLPLSILVLFRVFRAFRLGSAQAFVAAASLALLSPQIQRWGGHFALGHLVALPMALWLQLRRFPGFAPAPRGLGFDIALHSLAWGLIHPYYIPLFAFQSFFLESALRLRLRGAGWARAAGSLFVQTALPLAVFLALMRLTDPVRDRGAAEAVFNATFAGVFLARWRDLAAAWNPAWDKAFALPSFEGISALGASAIFLLFGAMAALASLATRRKRLPPMVYAGVAILVSGVAALFFSFGFHLKGGIGSSLQGFAVLRQFRSVGRFAWLFHLSFMVFGIAMAVHAARLGSFRRRWPRGFAHALVWGFLFVQAAEATLWFQWSLRQTLAHVSRLPVGYPGQGKLDPVDFQAIIPLPFFNIGSGGKDDLSAADSVLRETLLLSLATGIPVVGNHSSRSSLGQAALSVNAIHRGIGTQEWASRLKSEKDLLLWVDPIASLSRFERQLVSRAAPIELYGDGGLYRISITRLVQPLQ